MQIISHCKHCKTIIARKYWRNIAMQGGIIIDTPVYQNPIGQKAVYTRCFRQIATEIQQRAASYLNIKQPVCRKIISLYARPSVAIVDARMIDAHNFSMIIFVESPPPPSLSASSLSLSLSLPHLPPPRTKYVNRLDANLARCN